MKKEFVLELKRPARKSGGDRYECADLTIYVPQDISRPDGTPLKHITVTFEAGGES
jgi:hypothetical protein